MKSHFISMTAILAATVGFGVFSNAVADSSDAAANEQQNDHQQLGDHPAVIVARTQPHGIDPNTFIVRHPAAPNMVAAAPKDTKSTQTASAGR